MSLSPLLFRSSGSHLVVLRLFLFHPFLSVSKVLISASRDSRSVMNILYMKQRLVTPSLLFRVLRTAEIAEPCPPAELPHPTARQMVAGRTARSRRAALLSLLVTFFVESSVAREVAAQGPTGRIVGRVVDAKTGQGVVDAGVQIAGTT